MDINYEKDVQVDPDALDVEWLAQPHLALRYGKLVVDLKQKVRRLEEKVKTIRSELIREANENPEETCHKQKPNAADIEAYYRTHPRYKEAVKELHEALYELEFAEVAKNEICFTRKAVLENLVSLYGMQYFAGPKIPRDLNKEWERKQKQLRSNEQIAAKTRLRRTRTR